VYARAAYISGVFLTCRDMRLTDRLNTTLHTNRCLIRQLVYNGAAINPKRNFCQVSCPCPPRIHGSVNQKVCCDRCGWATQCEDASREEAILLKSKAKSTSIGCAIAYLGRRIRDSGSACWLRGAAGSLRWDGGGAASRRVRALRRSCRSTRDVEANSAC